MINPFDNNNYQVLLTLKLIKDMYKDFPVDATKKYLKYFLDNMLKDTIVKYDESYIIWAFSCIYDNILNHYDYSSYCLYNGESYSSEYISICESIKKGLERKKFFTKKPVYNLSKIIQDIIDSLDFVIGVVYHSEIMEIMESKNSEKEFESTIIDLQNRLSSHIEYDKLTI
ncbi:MAG: hypothetical protein K2G63_03645 [Oscillospiraceae bacterium]|nr:hypothetical protein [Oscillospiraceae bacterium]